MAEKHYLISPQNKVIQTDDGLNSVIVAAENKNLMFFLGWQLIDQILTIGSGCLLKYKENEDS